MTPSPAQDAVRVGLLTPAWPGTRMPNGIATAVTHIRSGLEACGCKVVIIPVTRDGPDGEAILVAIPELRRSLSDRLQARIDPWGAVHRFMGKRIAAAVTEAVQRHGIEVLVMEETYGWAGTVQRLVDIPVVATLHGPWFVHKKLHGDGRSVEDQRREGAEAAAIRRVKGITSPSQDVLDQARTAYGLANVPQMVIRNPMPLSDRMASPHSAPGARERLLFVGRFDYHKGGDVVIEAFARLAAVHPTCRLTFVGPVPGVLFPDGQHLSIDEALDRLPSHIRERVDVRGPVGRDEVSALRGSHAISIVASRYENFGGTMTEAMAAGSALVCTAVGGCPEMIIDGATGLLVAPDDPEAMATGCLRLLRDPALAARIGSAARSHIGKELDPVAIGRQMAAFLATICRR